MNRNLFFYFLFLFFLGASCTSSHERIFEDLNAQERKMLQKELMDSLNAEMYSMTFAIDKDSNQIIGMGSGWHERLIIGYNEKGDLVIPEEKMKGNIVSSIENYLLMNRKENRAGNGFPLYVRYPKNQLLQFKRASEMELAKMRKDSLPVDFIAYKKTEIIDCKKRLAAIKTLKVKELIEIDSRCIIELDYNTKIKGQSLTKDSALFAFFKLRNKAAIEHFNEPYLNIFYKFYYENSKVDGDKIDALKILFPICIWDIPNFKKYNLVHIGSIQSCTVAIKR